MAAAEQKHTASPPASVTLHTQLLLWERSLWTMNTVSGALTLTLYKLLHGLSEIKN